MNKLGSSLTIVAMVGIIFPPPLWSDEGPRESQPMVRSLSANSPSVNDISLSPKNELRGRVFDLAGHPQTGAAVALRQGSRIVQRGETGTNGVFAFRGLQGGQYQIVCGDQQRQVRVWTAEAAPPRALSDVNILMNEQFVQRGQQPIQALWGYDPLLLGLVVAAAIAIPIAIHNSDDDRQSGS